VAIWSLSEKADMRATVANWWLVTHNVTSPPPIAALRKVLFDYPSAMASRISGATTQPARDAFAPSAANVKPTT
jgi:hypothetical protein